MKDILIIANFCRDFSESDNGRFMYLCKELSKENRVEIVTSSFYHAKKEQRLSLSVEWPFKITFVMEPGYPKNVCLRRFISHAVWAENVSKYLKNRVVPDVIYCAIPSLSVNSRVADYCKKYNVEYVIDIQDLWPEAFQMVLRRIPLIGKLVCIPFKILADKAYSSADKIVAVSQTYLDRALQVNSKCRNGQVVFLGTKLQVFDQYAEENAVASKKADEIWLGYCGTLGSSYDLTYLMDALNLLPKDSPKYKLIIMGDGPRRKEFENYACQKRIPVEFLGRLDYPQMCGILCACDIAVNPISPGAAQSIINKHGDYAAAGIPVVSTQDGLEYCHLVTEYQMGFNCSNTQASELTQAVYQLMINESLRKEMGKNARRCAEEKFDRENTYKNIIKLLR